MIIFVEFIDQLICYPIVPALLYSIDIGIVVVGVFSSVSQTPRLLG